jgi:glycosyltransferase involved in cell wall biosynthesis
LVYEGGIGGTAHRDFLDLFTELARGGVQLHVYPARHDSQLADWFQRQTNLHYHQPVSPKEIMREMSRYDAGVIPFNLAKGNKRFLDSTIANKLFEYLAAGLPVVASDLKSYRDYFAANPVGFTFAGARDILDNLGRLAEISAGADLTRYGLTYEGEISRMVGFYREVLAGSAAQARSVASPA